MEKPISTKRHLCNVLGVISSSVILAFCLVGTLVYFSGARGQYTVGHVLLEPDLLARLQYTENRPSVTMRYQYDRIEFSSRPEEGGAWIQQEISLDKYRRFFDLVSKERSVSDESEAKKSFDGGDISRLILKVRTPSEASGQGSQQFQEVQFNGKNDLFRVELRQAGPTVEWAYFHSHQIYKEVLTLFLEK